MLIANCNSQPCQTKDLSVDILYAFSRTGIPTLVLKSMWSKAVDLLVSNEVLTAPGCPSSSRMVASRSKHKPHCVVLNRDGCFERDSECPSFL